MGSTASPATLRCGTSWILSIPRTCGPRSARSSVACNAARCSNASSIWTAITCCRWTAPPISPPPRSIVPPVWKSTIATAASPIPINCWGPPWSIPASRKSSRWHPSRSSSRTVKPRTTASGTPPAAGSNGFARSIPTCRSSSSKTPSAPTPPTSATCVRLARITSLASSRATTRFCSTTCGPSTRPARCRSLPWRIQRRALCIIFGSVMACRSTSRTPTSWSMWRL